jgi:hypothetical protein
MLVNQTPAWAFGLPGQNVLFVDPGITGTGLALFAPLDGSKPIRHEARMGSTYPGDWQDRAHYLKDWFAETIFILRKHLIHRVVIEMPRTFGSAKSYAATLEGSLSKLVFLIGLYDSEVVRHVGRRSILVEPDVWKGQLPKKVVDGRIAREGWGKYSNHTSDAVGMGLAALGRL